MKEARCGRSLKLAYVTIELTVLLGTVRYESTLWAYSKMRIMFLFFISYATLGYCKVRTFPIPFSIIGNLCVQTSAATKGGYCFVVVGNSIDLVPS